jgi:hypothetical protein
MIQYDLLKSDTFGGLSGKPVRLAVCYHRFA